MFKESVSKQSYLSNLSAVRLIYSYWYCSYFYHINCYTGHVSYICHITSYTAVHKVTCNPMSEVRYVSTILIRFILCHDVMIVSL